MKKVLTLEVEFADGFVPPDKFEARKGACALCPFYAWKDAWGNGYCTPLGEEPKTDICPIKKFFN